MRTLEEERQAALEAIQKAEESKAFYLFFKERPDLACDANENVIRKHHNGDEITLESIRESVSYLESNHPAKLARKNTEHIFRDELQKQQQQKAAEAKTQADALAAEAKERDQLAQQIKSLLKVSPMMLQNEMNKYQLKDAKGHWICPTSVMRQRLQALKETSVFRGSTTEQLKQYLQGTQPKKATEYPPLPTRVSAQQIRLMWDATTLRNAIKKYGAAAITQRLQEGENE